MRNRLACASLFAALLLGGCGSSETSTAKITEPVTLSEGTAVKLMLLEQIESGATPEGDEVTFMVAEDVKGPNGAVAIPKGSIATATVSWSRRADTISTFTNRPARLAVKLKSVKAANGDEVPLTASEAEDDGAFQFTRGNTGRTELSSKVESLWGTEEGQKLLTQVQELLEDGQSLDSVENAEALSKAIEKLEMPNATELVKQGRIGEVQGILDKLKSGQGLAELAASNLTGLGAVMELANLAGDVGNRLGRMMKGRNIKAYVGTPVDAVVSEQVTLQPK